MNDLDFKCMQMSINLANDKHSQSLAVGLVIRVNDNMLITATSLENNKSAWVKEAISKLTKNNITEVLGIYLTINTISFNGEFNLNELLKVVSTKFIYVGLPDPQITNYLNNDPVILRKDVFRYPDNLQKLIIEQNCDAFANSKQNILNSPYYANIRISNLIQSKLEKLGISISKREVNDYKSVDKLSTYLKSNRNISLYDANNIVTEILSESFNEKYAIYDYAQDARFVSDDWVTNFKNITQNLMSVELTDKKILNLGVGSGEEAIKLFSHCKLISFVDIAPDGLKKIKNLLPWVEIIQSRAEKLETLHANVYDIYISLRTYNSSFFDFRLALL